MPKAKPVSLHPLTFNEAIKALVGVDPGRDKPNSKRTTLKVQKKVKHRPGKK